MNDGDANVFQEVEFGNDLLQGAAELGAKLRQAVSGCARLVRKRKVRSVNEMTYTVKELRLGEVYKDLGDGTALRRKTDGWAVVDESGEVHSEYSERLNKTFYGVYSLKWVALEQAATLNAKLNERKDLIIAELRGVLRDIMEYTEIMSPPTGHDSSYRDWPRYKCGRIERIARAALKKEAQMDGRVSWGS